MKQKRMISTICFLTWATFIFAQPIPEYVPITDTLPPLKLAKFVADNIVDQTKFEYQYVAQKPYTDLEFVDFGQSFDKSRPGVAYALSTLFSETEQVETIELGSTSKLKVWVNDQLVFTQNEDSELSVIFDEQTYTLPKTFEVKLNEGENKILIKSSYSGKGDWQLFMQSVNMGRYAEKGKKITASLKNYAPNIDLVNWLVLGCFESPDGNGLNTAFDPEHKIELHKLYQSGGQTFTWDIPRLHIITENPGGGKFYRWVYHVGGFIWGLQRLSEETKDQKYANHADKWCEYTLKTMPMAEYQTRQLHAVRSMNWVRPMLDYTTAPSLPFINRLIGDNESFQLRKNYIVHVEKIMNYVLNEQYRLSSGAFMRKYMGSPTVWADDMFMGIPYLLFSAKYTHDPILRKQLYNDAANQVIQLNKLLYKEEKQLYMQACYVDRRDEVIPFWSRGNGWAIWGTSEALLHLPKNHDEYNAVLEIYRNHIKGITRAQDAKGYWHNILDMPETVMESSGTAIFTLCIARGINHGWLDKKEYGAVVEKAWAALKSFIDKEGNLHCVKGGTNFSPDPEDYAKVRFLKSDTHGIFPLLFACIEMDQYFNRASH